MPESIHIRRRISVDHINAGYQHHSTREIIFREQLCTKNTASSQGIDKVIQLLIGKPSCHSRTGYSSQTYRGRMNDHPAKYIAEAFPTTEVLEACIGV
jgi:hypothetical protein